MEEPRMAPTPEEPKTDPARDVERTIEVPAPIVEESHEAPGVSEELPVSTETVLDLDKLDLERETTGLTVGDGFRFGCGFVLAMAIGTLAFLIVITAFLAVGTLMGFKLPF